MKKFLIAAVIILCATGIAQATIIIDDFTKNGTPNNDLTIGPGTNPTGDLTATRTGPTANIMGGTCNITFNRSAGNSSVSYYVTGAPPYYAEYSSAYTANEVGYWRMEYGKSANLNADLSYGASAIQVDIVNSDMCFSGTDTRSIPTTLTITSGKETTPVTASKTINIKCDGTYNFNFGDFTGVNFADVDYIKIQFDFINATQNNVDVAITKIYTVGTTEIELVDFQATPGNGQVTLKWETATEIDNAGFNIYRAEEEDGEYVQINEDLIPAQGSATEGAAYELIDTSVKNGNTYYYELEDIDLNGTVTMHGPVSATPIEQPIKVSLDIKPGSCPNPIGFTNNNGFVPFAIMGTVSGFDMMGTVEDFDVTQIDPASIRITRDGVDAEVAPIRWTYEDVATPFEGELCNCHWLKGDGIMDLSMKAYTNDLVDVLKLKEVAGETIPLTITGKLKDEFGGTPIEGKDCVRILKAVLKGKK